MKYFGTDGIRGKLKKDLNSTLINKVAKAIVLYYKKHNLKKVLLIGNDSRLTSDYILTQLASKLLRNGIEIHNIGICSSPSLAYLTNKFNYPLGLMLSASHNPAEYNGLKFFNRNGEKVDDEFEEEFEALMQKKCNLNNTFFAKLKNKENLLKVYIDHVKSIKKFNFPVILDCANGGTCEICNTIFPQMEKINNNANGININHNAGCTNIDMLKSLCILKQKIGFAFDGDGDRIHIVDKDGTIVSGDEILYILSKFYQFEGDVCIGTIYTNTGLEEALKSRNIHLKRSDVGDKKVYKLMKETSSILGGEDSGHIILKHFMNTGDGLIVAILVANLMELSKSTLKELLDNYVEHHQMRKDVKTDNKDLIHPILNSPNIKNTISQLENNGVKVVVRPSGTEPVIRLFVEHQSLETAKKAISTLFTSIQDILFEEKELQIKH